MTTWSFFLNNLAAAPIANELKQKHEPNCTHHYIEVFIYLYSICYVLKMILLQSDNDSKTDFATGLIPLVIRLHRFCPCFFKPPLMSEQMMDYSKDFLLPFAGMLG